MESAQTNDSSPDPLVDRVLGSYRIVRKMAEGGMGAVYEALHTELGRRAAVKVLLHELVNSADAASRFFNEAKAVSLVTHPSLVTIYEHGTSLDGAAYIVMEYLDGESLRQRLARRYLGGSAMGLVRQMASALAVTHKKRILHRDLKPENVMLVSDDEVAGGERAKILDFGIAKLLPDGGAASDQRSVKTRTGTLIGTPTYMSPEQCRASAAEPPDERTDVYSLGIIFYELLYGEPPFISDSAGELFALQMFAAPPDLKQRVPALAPGVAELVHRLLDKKPAARPSMAELLTELQTLPGSGVKDGPAASAPSAHAEEGGREGANAGNSDAIRAHLTGKTSKNNKTGKTGNTGHGEQVASSPAPRRSLLLLALLGLFLIVGAAVAVKLLRPPVPQPAGPQYPSTVDLERPQPAAPAADGGASAGAPIARPEVIQGPPSTRPSEADEPHAEPQSSGKNKRGKSSKHRSSRNAAPQGSQDEKERIELWN